MGGLAGLHLAVASPVAAQGGDALPASGSAGACPVQLTMPSGGQNYAPPPQARVANDFGMERTTPASTGVLVALQAQLKAMPATEACASALRAWRYNDPRFKGLAWSDLNQLDAAVKQRLGQIDAALTEAKCAPMAARAGIPAEIKGNILVDPVDKMTIERFVCAAYVATGNVRTTVFPNGSVTVKVQDTTLVFRRGIYQARSDGFFASNATVADGRPALSLTQVRGPNGVVAFNRYFLLNYYSQFTPHLAAYLRGEVAR